MSPKKDFLGECNNFAIPIPDFTASFCQRCWQGECSRSQFGKSAFDQRVSTWIERLVTPPKMDPNDPRYLPIVNQGFRPIQTTVPSVWSDDTGESAAAPAVPQVVQAPEVTMNLTPPAPAPKIGEKMNLLMNTPQQAGKNARSTPCNEALAGSVGSGESSSKCTRSNS